MPVGGRGRGGDPDAGDPRRAGDRRSRPRTAMRSPRRAARISTRRTTCCVASRPTAVNLRWALDEMRADPTAERARALHEDEVERCRRMARHAAGLLAPGSRPFTHCNAGGLATGGYGSALGAIRAAWERRARRARVGGRDAAAAPGGAADRVGARAARDPVLGDRRLRGRVAHGRAARSTSCHRRRPHRGERRHGEQDRHVRARRRGRAPRHPARTSSRRPRRSTRTTPTGAEIPIEERDRARGLDPLRGAQPRLRRHAGRADRRDRDRGRACTARRTPRRCRFRRGRDDRRRARALRLRRGAVRDAARARRRRRALAGVERRPRDRRAAAARRPDATPGRDARGRASRRSAAARSRRSCSRAGWRRASAASSRPSCEAVDGRSFLEVEARRDARARATRSALACRSR